MTLENEPIASAGSISSCAPDWQQMGYLMAHGLMGDIPVARSSQGFIPISCPLVQRGTMVLDDG